jgi:hypothetical protein
MGAAPTPHRHTVAPLSPAMNSRHRISCLRDSCRVGLSRLRFHGNRQYQVGGTAGASDPGDARRPENGGSRGGWPVMRLHRPGAPAPADRPDRAPIRLLRRISGRSCRSSSRFAAADPSIRPIATRAAAMLRNRTGLGLATANTAAFLAELCAAWSGSRLACRA